MINLFLLTLTNIFFVLATSIDSWLFLLRFTRFSVSYSSPFDSVPMFVMTVSDLQPPMVTYWCLFQRKLMIQYVISDMTASLSESLA